MLGCAFRTAFAATCFRLLCHILAELNEVLDVLPAADQYGIRGAASDLEILAYQSIVQVAKQEKTICMRSSVSGVSPYLICPHFM